jgi:hypothetical protein
VNPNAALTDSLLCCGVEVGSRSRKSKSSILVDVHETISLGVR